MGIEKGTTAELRRQNRNNIFRMIYQNKRTAKQEIAAELGLSLPTVTQNLKELEALQLIERSGLYASSGGRKPQAICCVRRCRAAIGISADKHSVHIACIDLYGTVIKEEWFDLTYDIDIAYCKKVGELLHDFISELRISKKKILGVGITLQGIVSSDGQYISYGKILNNTGVRLEDFARFIPYPCRLIHDAEAAAIAELHVNPQMSDTVYLSLSNNVGSAIILDGAIYHGQKMGGGLIEHMTLVPDGVPCYCGRRGCMEAYCSIQSLCEKQKNLPTFFAAVRSGEPLAAARWHEYLKALAVAIDNIHMVIDCNILLGGPLTAYISNEEMEYLNELILERCFFMEKRAYVQISQYRDTLDVIGGAWGFVEEFIAGI